MSLLSIDSGKRVIRREAAETVQSGFCTIWGPLCMAILELVALVILSLGTLGTAGCALFNTDPQTFEWTLEGEGWELQPDGSWRGPGDGALAISFSSPVRQDALSSIVRVFSHNDEVEVLKNWRDGSLVVSAAAGWEPGRRYLLVMQGLVQAEDGREDALDWSFVFHCKRLEPFTLESHLPGDGAAFDCSTGALPELVLSFSHPVDRASFDVAFSISGFGTWTSVWDESGRLVRVRPEEGMLPQPWLRIPWQLSLSLKDSEGARLLEAVSASFICEGRIEPPGVAAYFTAIESGENWLEAIEGLDELREGEVPGVRFSSPMHPASLENALYLRPSRTCRVLVLDPYRAILVPQQALEPSSDWTLCISQNARDASGNPLASAASASFKSASRIFDLESVYLNEVPMERSDSGSWRGVLLGYGDDIVVDFFFTAALVAEERSSILRALRIDPLFPDSLPYPKVRAAEALGERGMRVFVSGMGREGGPAWYRLSLFLEGCAAVPEGYRVEGSGIIEVELKP